MSLMCVGGARSSSGVSQSHSRGSIPIQFHLIEGFDEPNHIIDLITTHTDCTLKDVFT
jgi:hypothetical protein